MRLPFRRQSRNATPDTGPRRLVDIDTERREWVTHLVRPDSLSPLDLPSAARSADTSMDANAVILSISRLANAGGIDEFVPDTLDGVIDAWRAQWDSRVDELFPGQVLTSLRLAGQELENVTACAARVQDLRDTVTTLDVEINNWRGVLRGHITHLPFPEAARVNPVEQVDLPALMAGATLGDQGRAACGEDSPQQIAAASKDSAGTPQVLPMYADSDRDDAAAI